MVDIEKLVSDAKEELKIMGDDKVWCRSNELIALLEAGATPIEINQEQVGRGGTYSHVVSYKNIIFTNSTSEPVPELEKYSVKKQP